MASHTQQDTGEPKATKNGLHVETWIFLGLTAFFVIAIMLSLLIFVGEAVRDALDPRKTMA